MLFYIVSLFVYLYKSYFYNVQYLILLFILYFFIYICLCGVMEGPPPGGGHARVCASVVGCGGGARGRGGVEGESKPTL